MSAYQLGVLSYMGINIILAYSLFATLLTGQLSLGNAGFMAIGAYLSSVLTVRAHVPLLPALLVGALAAGVVGVGVGFPALRLRGVYLAIATLGFGEIVRTFFLNFDPTGSAQGFRGMSGVDIKTIWVFVLMVMAFFWLLTRSRLGHTFEAVRDDEVAAQLTGLRVTRLKVSAFGLSALIAGLGGGLYAHYALYIEPGTFDFLQSANMLLFVILGGTEHFLGAFAGAAIFTLLPEWLRFLQDWRYVFYGGVLIVLMILRPEGLVPRALFPRRHSSAAASGTGRTVSEPTT